MFIVRTIHIVTVKLTYFVTDEYMIWKREINICQERNAYCIELGETCICQCWPEYLMVNGHCLEGKTLM